MKQSKDSKYHTKNVKKSKYRVKNWSVYNQALIQRGSLTLWISEDIESWWNGQGKEIYSDRAIETMLTLKALHGLPLRSTTGFARSIFKLSNIHLFIPDYTTISRRAKKLNITLKKRKKEKINLVLDSTGAKIYGEGEWKVRQHGWSKRRTWKKIHIGIDSDGEIRAVVDTDKNTHDSEVIDDILNQEEAKIDSFHGDGGYDMAPVYMSLAGREISKVCIPPRVNSVIQIHGNTKGPPYARDENLRVIRRTSRKRWKIESGYHTRSLVENTMYRLKTILGDRLSFRTNESQSNEILIKCSILNVFHSLGMPESYAVATP